MILLISSEIDSHATEIQKYIGKHCKVLTPSSVYCLDITEDGSKNEFTSIWYRVPKYIEYKTDDKKVVLSKFMALRESQDFFANYLSILRLNSRDLFILNDPVQSYYSQFKNYQLQVAKQLGLNVPKTLVTKDKKSLLIFIKSNSSKRFIIKNYRGSVNFGDEYLTCPTMLIDTDQFVSNFDNIDLVYPSIYQEYIDKLFELRIIVVGNKIFVAKIISQDNPETEIDFRVNYEHLRYENFQIPTDVETKIIKLTKKLGLNYACIDMIYSTQNKYIFLEINNNGQYLWLEKALNLDISKQIALLLTSPEKYKLV